MICVFSLLWTVLIYHLSAVAVTSMPASRITHHSAHDARIESRGHIVSVIGLCVCKSVLAPIYTANRCADGSHTHTQQQVPVYRSILYWCGHQSLSLSAGPIFGQPQHI